MSEGVLQHFCESYYLAQKVAENLETRYGNEAIISNVDDSNGNNYHFDPGGMLIGGEKFTFQSPCVDIICNHHDWELFKRRIERSLRNQDNYLNHYNEEFYKFHSYFHILCLTEHQRDYFLNLYDIRKDECDRIQKTWHIQQISHKVTGM